MHPHRYGDLAGSKGLKLRTHVSPQAGPGYRSHRKAATRAGVCAFVFYCAQATAAPPPSSPSYDCLIEPAQTVEVGTPVAGLLDRVAVKRGDRVTRNQVLATLESHAEQAAADLARYKSQLAGPTQVAESKIEFSGRKYDRRRDMAAEKLMSPQDRDDAEAELKLAKAELQTAKENREIARLEYSQQNSQLALRTIRSPFDGVVVDQMIWPGEVVEPGATKHAILKLAKLDPLRVRVVMPMRAFGEPKVGGVVRVAPEIQQDKSYTAHVASIDRVIDAASGTFVVLLDLPNSALDLPSGVKCKATFASTPP
ncbi:RND family efflux transporter MFP subunit [Luteibacter rhizovicinus]|uniref:RND family efflux transporter MFP subunit n=1 Tax=Luteibacter rhizovicinus TaxID=242606 RepID=A0A4R3YM24_9GAMM|nr:efflux RND transporter periplasmic adaptor subunit [Luteibacter rhizovicinus]TCV93356.1 RND family efflux transporter MFP subunit [Luteibacter rhizovicinus]